MISFFMKYTVNLYVHCKKVIIGLNKKMVLENRNIPNIIATTATFLIENKMFHVNVIVDLCNFI